jgi:uncharacterized protein
VPTLIVLGVLALLFGVFTNLWTERLWFTSVGFGEVFTTQLVTQVVAVLRVRAADIRGAIVGTAVLAYRLRPRYRPMSVEQQSLERYREAIEPSRRGIVLIGAGILAVTSGLGAAAAWQTFLVWWNRTPFGETDPQFNVDVGFYIFEYPWWRFVLSFAFATVILALITAAVVHYLYGGIRLQTPGEKVTGAAIAHLSALAAVLMLLKAAAYWLDRYGLVLEDSPLFTGAGIHLRERGAPGEDDFDVHRPGVRRALPRGRLPTHVDGRRPGPRPSAALVGPALSRLAGARPAVPGSTERGRPGERVHRAQHLRHA